MTLEYQKINGGRYDQERAFYGEQNLLVEASSFDGEADGESAFKECRNIAVRDCYFNLRYPFWLDEKIEINACHLTELCRAALWYSSDISVFNTKMHGIKALRECHNISVASSDIISTEFGWLCQNVKMENSSAKGEYFMFRSENLTFNNVTLLGKYSFQYITDSVFENCNFDTKDAFWHAKNVTVKNSVIKGEYLGWYCENVTFENCIIEGTQPLCYCKGLKLINCQMNGADFAFEKSDVDADVTTPVISIKNPKSGKISVPAADEIILDEPTDCVITVGE